MLRLGSLAIIFACGLYLVFGGLDALEVSKGMRLAMYLGWIGLLLGWFFIPARGGGRGQNDKAGSGPPGTHLSGDGGGFDGGGGGDGGGGD